MINANQTIEDLQQKVRPLVEKHGFKGFMSIPMKQGCYLSVSVTSVRNLCEWTSVKGSMSIHLLEAIDKMASAIIDHDNGEPTY